MVKPLGKELYITKELLEIVMYAKTHKFIFSKIMIMESLFLGGLQSFK